MAKLTQTQIVTEMAAKTGISKKQVKDVMQALTDLAYREVKKGEFELPGLGKLVKQKRKARVGRNPATAEPIKIPPKTVLKFRVAKAARDAVLGSSRPSRPSSSDSDLADVLREIGHVFDVQSK